MLTRSLRPGKLISAQLRTMMCPSTRHCLHAKCAMNGSNNLGETDRAPNRLCAECQKKLYWNLRYDNQKRLQELVDYCRQHQLQRDLGLLQKDLDALR